MISFGHLSLLLTFNQPDRLAVSGRAIRLDAAARCWMSAANSPMAESDPKGSVPAGASVPKPSAPVGARLEPDAAPAGNPSLVRNQLRQEARQVTDENGLVVMTVVVGGGEDPRASSDGPTSVATTSTMVVPIKERVARRRIFAQMYLRQLYRDHRARIQYFKGLEYEAQRLSHIARNEMVLARLFSNRAETLLPLRKPSKAKPRKRISKPSRSSAALSRSRRVLRATAKYDPSREARRENCRAAVVAAERANMERKLDLAGLWYGAFVSYVDSSKSRSYRRSMRKRTLSVAGTMTCGVACPVLFGPSFVLVPCMHLGLRYSALLAVAAAYRVQHVHQEMMYDADEDVAAVAQRHEVMHETARDLVLIGWFMLKRAAAAVLQRRWRADTCRWAECLRASSS